MSQQFGVGPFFGTLALALVPSGLARCGERAHQSSVDRELGAIPKGKAICYHLYPPFIMAGGSGIFKSRTKTLVLTRAPASLQIRAAARSKPKPRTSNAPDLGQAAP